MPVLASEDRIAPKSILRHRPIGERTATTEDVSQLLSMPQPLIHRASRPPHNPHNFHNPHDPFAARAVPEEDREVGTEWERDNGKRERGEAHTGPADIETARLARVLRSKFKLARSKRKQHQAHPMLYLGAGMVVTILLWIVLSSVYNWVSVTLDDIHYGRPRTFQTDAWVGHNEQDGVPSHFIAINLNRHIEIIELPGGDPAHARIYPGPQVYGANDELAPVTLKFVDINKDHRPAMLVNFQGTHFVFINDHDGFRPMNASEHDQIEHLLRSAAQ